MRWKNECTSHNLSLFAIFLPKVIKIGGNLTKQFCTVFLRHCVYRFSVGEGQVSRSLASALLTTAKNQKYLGFCHKTRSAVSCIFDVTKFRFFVKNVSSI